MVWITLPIRVAVVAEIKDVANKNGASKTSETYTNHIKIFHEIDIERETDKNQKKKKNTYNKHYEQSMNKVQNRIEKKK